MKPGGKTAAEALFESPVAALVDQARKLDRVSSLVIDFSRELAGDDQAPSPNCLIRGREVVISVSTASQAAKLRQRTATLTRLLQEFDADLTGFRLRVQPSGMVDHPPTQRAEHPRDPPSKRSMEDALRFAEDLARSLNDSPLRDAALRLRSRLLRTLGRAD